MGANVLEELENQMKQMQAEITRLRLRTDLEPLHRKLDSSMGEVRLLHTGLLETLQQMIVDLNAEGVKRYEGAVNAVTSNSSNLAKQILVALVELKKDVEILKKEKEEENQKAS